MAQAQFDAILADIFAFVASLHICFGILPMDVYNWFKAKWDALSIEQRRTGARATPVTMPVGNATMYVNPGQEMYLVSCGITNIPVITNTGDITSDTGLAYSFMINSNHHVNAQVQCGGS